MWLRPFTASGKDTIAANRTIQQSLCYTWNLLGITLPVGDKQRTVIIPQTWKTLTIEYLRPTDLVALLNCAWEDP